VPGGLDPFIVDVPRFPARTMDQVKLKASIWPVFYEAQNHRELQEASRRWTRATVQWFRDAVAVLRKEAKRVRLLGEVRPPIPFTLMYPVRTTSLRRFQLWHTCQCHSMHLSGHDHLLRMTCVCPRSIHSDMLY
jgi:tRNA-specific adenosine deaminase 3